MTRSLETTLPRGTGWKQRRGLGKGQETMELLRSFLGDSPAGEGDTASAHAQRAGAAAERAGEGGGLSTRRFGRGRVAVRTVDSGCPAGPGMQDRDLGTPRWRARRCLPRPVSHSIATATGDGRPAPGCRGGAWTCGGP